MARGSGGLGTLLPLRKAHQAASLVQSAEPSARTRSGCRPPVHLSGGGTVTAASVF